jgi:hypothetical protein
VARVCRCWLRRGAGIRGVQLQPEGGGAGYQEAGVKLNRDEWEELGGGARQPNVQRVSVSP